MTQPDGSGSFGPVDILLADGTTARVRPVLGGDRGALITFHGKLSRDSAALRYFGAHPTLSEKDLSRILGPNPDHCSLVAERHGQVIALAEYHRLVGSDEADVAFVVDDASQGKGLGTILLEHLGSEARRHGVRRFVADTLVGNARMLDVFRSAGFVASTSLDYGVVHVVLDIDPSPESVAAAEDRDRKAVVRSMERLLKPASIAVIGASRRPGSIGHALVTSLVLGGFTGPVYPVNPNAASVASLPCWPNVKSVPGDVDLAIVAVPAASVPAVVAECGEKGVGGLVIVSSGFAEAGGEGSTSQGKITAAAHAAGMRVVGPNCFGVVNTDPLVQMNATFSPERPLPGRVGFASQSGGLGIAILAEAKERGIGLSSFVSMGNKADVSGNDLLAWWEADPATDVALLYLESFGNPRKFARLARRVGRSKPIVAVKAGRSTAGAAAASSHTAAMASSDQAVGALFRQSGVIRVDTVEELFDVAEVLANQPVPKGSRVAIVTNAGGPGVLAADACARAGLDVPELSAGLQAELASLQTGIASVSNPVDLAASATPGAFEGALRLVLDSNEVDAVVVIFTPPLVTRAAAVAEGVIAGIASASNNGRHHTVLATFFGAAAAKGILAAADRPVPCFTYPETAIRALAHAVSYGRWLAKPAGTMPELSGVNANKARCYLAEPDEDGWVTGAAALGVLREFGIPTVESREATDSAGAAAIVTEVGAPVALKAYGPGLVHKTEAGGVRLSLGSPAEVAAAFDEMKSALGPLMAGAVVQPMVTGAVEVIMGALQDKQFGPVVLFGLGGTAAEILDDHKVALAPLSREEASEMILGVRAAKMLTGFRGSEPVDLGALQDCLLRIGRLAEDLPEILEADCNPVMASPTGAVVVDARIRVASAAPAVVDDRRRLR